MPAPAETLADLAEPAPRRPWRLVERTLVVAGLVLLAGLVRALGGTTLVANLRVVGWGIVAIIAQEILAIVANTLGWRAAFPAGRPTPAFAQLLAARIAGDAVNYVTPTATLGGEFARARLLEGRASSLDLATSIAVAKLSQVVAQVAFVCVGLVLVLAVVPLASSVRLGLVTGAVVLSALVCVFVVAQRRGMFGPLVAIATRLDRGGRLVDVTARLRRLDDEIARVHLERRGPFLVSCAWFFVGWALGALEIDALLRSGKARYAGRRQSADLHRARPRSDEGAFGRRPAPDPRALVVAPRPLDPRPVSAPGRAQEAAGSRSAGSAAGGVTAAGAAAGSARRTRRPSAPMRYDRPRHSTRSLAKLATHSAVPTRSRSGTSQSIHPSRAPSARTPSAAATRRDTSTAATAPSRSSATWPTESIARSANVVPWVTMLAA
ncbi:MAG: hypothetical protein E6J72_05505 [Deltaproteobacteria bacterium]|nr:MAG: hypothetical protein E6J72_05505 [Deltaproteobacteria bacterium]